MKNLFFGENRFVMENPPSKKEIFAQSIGQSAPDNVLAERYEEENPFDRDAYRMKLEEIRGASIDDVEFENEWRALGHELGATIADDLMRTPASTTPGRATDALPAGTETPAAAPAEQPAEIKTVEELIAAVGKEGDDLTIDHLAEVFKIPENKKIIEGTFPFKADGTMNIECDNEGNDVYKWVLPKMKNIFIAEKVKPFAVLFKGKTDAQVGELLAVIYTKGITGELKKKMEKYNDFLKAATAGEDRKITGYKITLGSEQPGSSTTVLSPEEVAVKYEEFKKAAETPPPSTQETQDAAEEQAKIDQIKATWIGKLLGMLGYGEKDKKTGLTGFQKLVRGEDWFGMFLLGILGYKELAPGYEDMVSALPDSVQAPIRSVEESARKSNFGKLAEKAMQNLDRVTAGVSANRLSAEEFAKKFEGDADKKIVLSDEKALRLTSNYTIGKVLKITLPANGRLIVPSSKDGEILKEVTMERINFDPSTGLWDVTNSESDPKVYQFTGVLPKDTMVLGKGTELKLLDEVEATPVEKPTATAVPDNKPATTDTATTVPAGSGAQADKPVEGAPVPDDKPATTATGTDKPATETAKPDAEPAKSTETAVTTNPGAATVPESPAQGAEA